MKVVRWSAVGVAIYYLLSATKVLYPHEIHPAFALISTDDGSRGSGVLVQKADSSTCGADHVVTAWHVIRDARRIACTFPKSADRRRFYARVCGVDRHSDLALLHTGKTGLKPFPIAWDFIPKAGGTVWTYGKPGKSPIRWNSGQIERRTYYTDRTMRIPLLSWLSNARGGESGGPVFVRNGLVSIISAADGHTIGAHPSTLRRRLTEW